MAIIVFSESYRRLKESSRENGRLLDELIEAQGHLRHAAVMEERQWLAREMHDAVGHRLTVASIHLEAVCRLIESDPERAVSLAGTSRDQVRAALGDLRKAVSSLADSPIDPGNLLKQIRETISLFHQGMNITVSDELDPLAAELDSDHSEVILRTVQEGLTNIQRHSQAAKVQIRLTVDKDRNLVELTIDDDGTGKVNTGESSSIGGFGLRSLRERASAIGGSLSFSRNGRGSQLKATLPISRNRKEDL